MGAGEKDSADRYVCPVGLPGEYRLIVQHVSGDVVGKRAVLKIVRYQGSDHELKDEFTIPLGEADKSVRITLQHGRLKELAAIPLLDVPAEERSTGRRSRREIARRTTAVARQMARPELTAGQIGAGGQLGLAGAPAGVGYQPIITVVNEGVTFSALAVVSGDRRYVRLTLSPVFNAITDVQLFSFVSGGGSSTGVQTGGGTGGTGGGRP
jgi:hypothetical protein